LRPGGYDPADYAAYVVRSAEEAAVSPLLVMTVLHNEAYKPHHPLLELLWQWWKPGAGRPSEWPTCTVRRSSGFGERTACQSGGKTFATIPLSPSTRRPCI
jgi:hypothetical protein